MHHNYFKGAGRYLALVRQIQGSLCKHTAKYCRGSGSMPPGKFWNIRLSESTFRAILRCIQDNMKIISSSSQLVLSLTIIIGCISFAATFMNVLSCALPIACN